MCLIKPKIAANDRESLTKLQLFEWMEILVKYDSVVTYYFEIQGSACVIFITQLKNVGFGNIDI